MEGHAENENHEIEQMPLEEQEHHSEEQEHHGEEQEQDKNVESVVTKKDVKLRVVCDHTKPPFKQLYPISPKDVTIESSLSSIWATMGTVWWSCAVFVLKFRLFPRTSTSIQLANGPWPMCSKIWRISTRRSRSCSKRNPSLFSWNYPQRFCLRQC
jgi:hypothetical protein